MTKQYTKRTAAGKAAIRIRMAGCQTNQNLVNITPGALRLGNQRGV